MNREEPRTFLGVAKDLLVRLVERGLNVPDARARRVELRPRTEARAEPRAGYRPASALPTVTLAEIYLAQGHRERALETLRSLLVREPDDKQARLLYERLSSGEVQAPEPRLKPESIEELIAAGPVEGEAMLPDRKGRPFCEAVRTLDDRISVRWSAGARVPSEAKAALEMVTIHARWTGPETRRDLLMVEVAGTREVIADAQTVIRFALGFVTADGVFAPLAHAPELEQDESGALFAWTQRGRERLASAPQSMSRG